MPYNYEEKYHDLVTFSEEFQEFLKFIILKREGKVAPSEKDNIPPVDLFCCKDKVVIEIELAGIEQEDIEITFVTPFLFIKGSKENKLKNARVEYLCMECAFGNFQRVIEIPYSVNSAMSEASFNDGLLTISMPIVSNRRSLRKRITIK
ncbi:MAG: Hsp20/alpha crystallin family protein [Thermodesulfobacteriota bacterium]